MLLRTSLAVSLLALAACSSETNSNTNTNTPSADATTTVASNSSAPPAAPTSRDVCAMLSAEELKTAANLEGAEGKKSTSGGADVCSWFGSDGKALVVQVYPWSS